MISLVQVETALLYGVATYVVSLFVLRSGHDGKSRQTSLLLSLAVAVAFGAIKVVCWYLRLCFSSLYMPLNLAK